MIYLPSQAAVTESTIDFLLPSINKLVENGLHTSKPLRVFGWRIRKDVFCCHHGRQGPEALIVVSHGQCLVPWHEIALVRLLV